MMSAAVRLSLAAALFGLATWGAAAQEPGATDTYRNERHGFSLSYPAGAFAPMPQQPPATGEGRVFVSRDGNARLLAGALPNADGATCATTARWCCSRATPAPRSTTHPSGPRGSCSPARAMA